MPSLSPHLAALFRHAAARARGLMLGLTMESIVFRHEIGMDSYGRLRPGSPIYRIHGIMAAWLVFELVVLAVGGWRPLFISLSGVMVTIALATYPMAARRAFQNLANERASGSLDQLWMSGIGPGELFEGKFYGLLAPLIEMRRYLTLAGVLFMLAFLKLFPVPWILLSLVLWATAINHVGHSAVLGTLAGLRWGLLGGASAGDFFRNWRLNPWPDHLALNLKVGAMLALPLAVLFWLGTMSGVNYFPAFGLMLLMPFYAALHLKARHRSETERLRAMFRTMFNPEGVGTVRAGKGDTGGKDEGPAAARSADAQASGPGTS